MLPISCRRLLKSPVTYLLLFVAAIFFIRCYVHEPSGDEVIYQYVWEEGDTTPNYDANHKFERKISSFGDIVQTMVIHYHLWGGRTIVHGIEQAFTNHELAFSVINTLIFLLLIGLIYHVVASKYKPFNFLLCLSIILSLIFLFPAGDSLWTSVNYSLNYLWPSTMAISLYILWRKLEIKAIPSVYLPAVSVLAFVFGWSHESFSIPMSAAFILYYIIWHRNFNIRVLWIGVPLCIGTLILFMAPGNFVRAGSSYSGLPAIIYAIIGGVDLLTRLYIIWIMGLLAIIPILRGNGNRLISYINHQHHLTLLWVVALLFALVVHSAEHTFCFSELLSCILTIGYFTQYGVLRTRRSAVIIATLITCLFIPHQLLLARDVHVTYEHHQKIKKDIVESRDSLLLISQAQISPLTRPFIRQWTAELPFFPKSAAISVGQREKFKSLRLVNHLDYEAITNPHKYYTETNRLPGNAHIYYTDGCKYMWIKPGAFMDTPTIMAIYYPLDWHHAEYPYYLRIKFALMPDAYDNQEILKIDTLRCRFGEFYRIPYPSPRKIKELRIVE